MADTNFSNRDSSESSASRQHAVLRRSLKINYDLPEDIEFKIASSVEEIKAACEILYHGYTEAGFMKADGSGYRFTVYHALPTCYTLIVKVAGKVIATASLIIRSADGLPIESIFSITPYLGFGRRTAEVSGLTVHPHFRGDHGRIVFALFKYLYTIAVHFLNVTDLVITCNPKHFAFYNSIVLFQSASNEIKDSYDLVDGAPAVAGHLDLTTLPERYEQIYQGRPRDKNFYEYIILDECRSFKIPEGVETTFSGNRWTPDQLFWILNKLAIGCSSLSGNDLSMLRKVYGEKYNWVFERFAPSLLPPRQSARIDLNLRAVLNCKGAKIHACVLGVTDQEIHVSLAHKLNNQIEGMTLELPTSYFPYSFALGSFRVLGNDEYIFQITSEIYSTFLAHTSKTQCAQACCKKQICQRTLTGKPSERPHERVASRFLSPST